MPFSYPKSACVTPKPSTKSPDRSTGCKSALHVMVLILIILAMAVMSTACKRGAVPHPNLLLPPAPRPFDRRREAAQRAEAARVAELARRVRLTTLLSRPRPPIIPVSRPSLSRVPPGMRVIHPHQCIVHVVQVTGGHHDSDSTLAIGAR